MQAQPILDSITDFNGNAWHPSAVASYNNYTTHFNSCRGTGKLADLERDAILDRRHQYFCDTMMRLTNLGR